MADDGTLRGHVKTYDSLIAMLKWGAVTVGVIALLVIWIITR